MKKKRIGPMVDLEVRVHKNSIEIIMHGVVGWEDGPKKKVAFRTSAETFIKEWRSRWNYVREMNPHMEDWQVSSYVLHKWFQEKTMAGTEGWEMASETEWTTDQDKYPY